MATTATVKFYEHLEKEPILSVYHQYDGYIDGVGHELANFLKDKKILRGFKDEKIEDGFANGMGCLAAQYLAEIKTCIGAVYTTYSSDDQQYNYKVTLVDGKIIIEVDDYFKGTPNELLNFKEL